MAFCFGLVFLQQHQANSRATAKQEAYKAHAKLSSPSLKTIDTLQPVVVSPPAASAANPSSGIKTSAPPQPSKTSGAAVQSAVPNSLPLGAVIDGVATPAKKLLN